MSGARFPRQRRIPRAQVLLWMLTATLLIPAGGEAQEQEGYTNLQVLPSDVSRGQLMSVMRGFTGALGVRCSTCHIGEEGQPLSTYDFASDDKAAKLKAREMMRMVRTINDTYRSFPTGGIRA